MKYTQQQIARAVDEAGLPAENFDRILGRLQAQPDTHAQFEVAHVAYYLGALLVIGATGWFINNGWDTLRGWEIAAIAGVYCVLFAAVGLALSNRAEFKIPSGLLMAVAVCTVPLAVYGIERQLGWWPMDDPGSFTNFHPLINPSWIWMEICTIAASIISLRFVRFPFITAPAAYALWYMSMDATGIIFGKSWTWKQECKISIAFGLVMLVVAYALEGISELDFPFWLYLFGLLAFTGGLSLIGNGTQLGLVIYGLLHLAMIAIALILQRKVFLVFGAIGLFVCLSTEAERFFRDSVGFTFGLTLIGILFIVAGMFYKKNEATMTARLSALTPGRIRKLRAA